MKSRICRFFYKIKTSSIVVNILSAEFSSERFGLSDIPFSVDMKTIFSEIRKKYDDNDIMSRYIKHIDHENAVMTLILSNFRVDVFENTERIRSLNEFGMDILIRVK